MEKKQKQAKQIQKSITRKFQPNYVVTLEMKMCFLINVSVNTPDLRKQMKSYDQLNKSGIQFDKIKHKHLGKL